MHSEEDSSGCAWLSGPGLYEYLLYICPPLGGAALSPCAVPSMVLMCSAWSWLSSCRALARCWSSACSCCRRSRACWSCSFCAAVCWGERSLVSAGTHEGGTQIKEDGVIVLHQSGFFFFFLIRWKKRAWWEMVLFLQGS